MIKSEVKDLTVDEYPRLMIFTRTKNPFSKNTESMIVLFKNDFCGTVVSGSVLGYKVGTYKNEWDINKFKPFHGSVTLTQE